jgi:hypothetical protein
MVTLKASKLTLSDVHQLLNFAPQLSEVAYDDFLTLEPLTSAEQQDLNQIRSDFRAYLSLERASEGQVKALTTFPLLRLAGYYRFPIQINVEEGIDEITIADEDKTIVGRFDIVAVDRGTPIQPEIPLWILVIESKESGIEVRQALPQLLTYAHNSLKHQPEVWSLATNGLQYLFVRIRQETTPTYQLLPILDLMYSQSATLLVQVLKSIAR